MSNWFAVRLLFESVHSEQEKPDNTFEDRIVLFEAANEEAARQSARKYGEGEESGFINANGRRVSIFFREILDCQELIDEALTNATEVYHTFLTAAEVADLRRTLASLSSAEVNVAKR